ncbi:hydrolase [Leptobacterium flavescens]|uniref:Hydrolase n=1 Tax=Leptobacterium flavescens TaxID=472055 RepID=A0A6P0UHJ4_9FLAO|nr:DUF5916 domain-containing protein [Leptobacterium flavescens]NER12714.1 hydrolase [Leptobacterium flavescens]
MKFKTIYLLGICVLFGIAAHSQEQSTPTVPKRVYTTKAIGDAQAPTIDGLLNDESWNIVEWDGDFIENRPDENTAPTQKTRFKILYDNKNLYIGVRCYDTEPDKIVKRLSRRDGFAGDWIEINIDSYHDLRTAFSFNLTVAGVKGDEFVTDNGNNWDSSWNPIWYAKTNVDEEGWTAEMRIPLSQLRFGKSKEQIWGLQFTRRFFRGEERYVWQRVPQDAPGWVSEMGELHGLMDLVPQKQIEIQPYTVGSLETFEAEEGNPFRDGRESQLSGGVDGKIGITNDLTLDFTINPDFGQVEADPSAIALDGFQIFFQERRPFFVENKNIFDYRFSNSQAGNTFGFDNIFYSRRIGRNPQGFPDTESNEFVDRPENTTILGAAKFSGKTKNGWSIGILESVTAKEYAEIDNEGERREEVVEPLTNYFVGRLQKDFNDRNTFIGGIFTATNRNLTDNLDFLRKSAFSGGFDFKHQWKNRAWYLAGNVIFSHVKGSEEAILNTQESITHLFQRVDASHVEVDPTRTSLTGTGGNIQLGKTANGHWRFESGFTWRSPELELNDIGFLRQADDLRHYTWIGYRTLKPFSIFRNLGLNYNHWSAWDFEGNLNRLQWNVNSWANFQNNWFGNLGFNYIAIDQSNTALRGGPRLRRSPRVNYWNNIGTDNRKKVRFNLSTSGSKALDNSTLAFNLNFGLSYQPLNALRISAFPSYNINKDKLQFISNIDLGNNDIRYLNGEIDQRTLSMSVRVNYTINPNLTIQYWGQPFISRGRYSNFKIVTDPQAASFNDRFLQYNDSQIGFNSGAGLYEVDENTDGNIDFSFGDPDFAFVQFRSNLVLRWEYIPGSEIFLVWSQDISQAGNPQDGLFRNLDNSILGSQPKNIFLIKATYRFVL